jgi:hypothetical protein
MAKRLTLSLGGYGIKRKGGKRRVLRKPNRKARGGASRKARIVKARKTASRPAIGRRKARPIARAKTRRVSKPSREVIKRRARVVREKIREIRKARKPREKKRRKRPVRVWKKHVRPLPKRKPAEKRVVDHKLQIQEALERALELSKHEGRVYVVRNADGTVDGELRIMVPVGLHEREILKTLSQVTRVPRYTWMSLGCRYEPDYMRADDRDRYLMWQGMIDAATAFGQPHARGEYFATAITTCDDMRKRYGGRKAAEVVVRFHWNGVREGERPERKGR